MITTLKNELGYVITYCEWRLVGKYGEETPIGKYVWVNDIWCHADYRLLHKVNRIIDEVMRIVPQAEYVYFMRKDINNKIHIWTRKQMERRRHRYDNLIKGGK